MWPGYVSSDSAFASPYSGAFGELASYEAGEGPRPWCATGRHQLERKPDTYPLFAAADAE